MLKIPGRIPIRIFPLFWLLSGAIGWLNSDGNPLKTLVWIGIIFISVLVHELGHALTAILFGQRARIDLVGFGGVTHRHGGKLKFWQDFLVVFNGPLFGLFLAAASYLVLLKAIPPAESLARYALQIGVIANVFWTILNLLPVHPLDGGHLLTIVLQACFGFKGIKISLFLSMALAGLLSIYFFVSGAFLIGAFFMIFAFESYRTWRAAFSMSEKDQDIALQLLLKEAEKEMANGKQEDALTKFKEVKELSKQGILFMTASEKMAGILKEQGRLKEAYDLLSPLQAQLDTDSLKSLHKIAYESGLYREAGKLGERVYHNDPNYDTALLNALSYSMLNEPIPALGWLKRALSDGMPNLRAVLSKQEFDPIRKSSLFQKFENESL